MRRTRRLPLPSPLPRTHSMRSLAPLSAFACSPPSFVQTGTFCPPVFLNTLPMSRRWRGRQRSPPAACAAARAAAFPTMPICFI